MSTSASSSDSCTSPLVVNTPVTVQSALRRCKHAPGRKTAKLLGRAGARDQLAHGRVEHASLDDLELGPHLDELQSHAAQGDVGSRYRCRSWARSTTVTSSLDSSALPSASLARPGALPMVSMSLRVKLLLSSASDPPRRMMTRSARPVSASVWRKPDGHCQNRDQHRDHARDADDDDARGADALRQRLKTHESDGDQLLEHFFRTPRIQRLSMSASTTLSRMARSAGGVPTSSARRTATAKPGNFAPCDRSIPCRPCWTIGRSG